MSIGLSAALAVIGGVGGLSGVAALARSRAQNKLDTANVEKVEAETESVIVTTTRQLIDGVRQEMDLKVTALEREVGRLRGNLESAYRERDRALAVERRLRLENTQLHAHIESLNSRIESLEARVRVLTTAAELSEASARQAVEDAARDA